MNKIFTILSFAILITYVSCTKDVKAPATKISNSTAATLPSTTTQTSNQNQSGHTCGGDHSSSNGF